MKIIHKIYAKLTGGFWTSCPRCNKYFGKHQGMTHLVELKNQVGKLERFRYICGECSKALK